MTRILLGLVLVGVSPLGAQTVRVGIATGAINPLAIFATYGELGWQLLGAVEVGSRLSPVSVRVDGMHGETRSRGVPSSTLTGGTANLVYHLGAPRAPARVYLVAGLGLYQLCLTSHNAVTPASPEGPAAASCPISTYSAGGYGYGGGAGVSAGTGLARFFGEARYMNFRGTGFDPLNIYVITAGVSFGN